MAHSTAPKRKRKSRSKGPKHPHPPKPRPDYPLSFHASGKYQKSIGGKIHYFGRWGRIVNGEMQVIPGPTWEEAERIYNAQRADLEAGREPKAFDEGELTVSGLCDEFLSAKEDKLESGHIKQITFNEYHSTCVRVIECFGKGRPVSELKPSDFAKLRRETAKRWGAVRLGNEVVRVRSIFKWGYESDLIELPVKFGPDFKKPSIQIIDGERAPEEERMYTAAEIRALLDYATGPIRAMILLGINCGFGNGDCSSLPLSALDLDNGILKFRRPKTSVDRRAALWPETVAALREAVATRPKARDAADSECVFVTKYGRRWVREGTNAVGLEFGKLFKSNDPDATNPERSGVENIEGRGFYHLRHTFRTVADETLDFPAVRVFMGHKDRSIDATYRKLISHDRLRAVADYVHSWLYPATGNVAMED